MQAYSKGLLRFDSGSRCDDRWRLKEELLLEVLERENLAKLHELIHLSEVTSESTEHHLSAAERQYNRIVELLCPYMETGASDNRNINDKLMSAWEEAYGKMDDPETIASINRTIAALENRNCDV